MAYNILRGLHSYFPFVILELIQKLLVFEYFTVIFPPFLFEIISLKRFFILYIPCFYYRFT